VGSRYKVHKVEEPHHIFEVIMLSPGEREVLRILQGAMTGGEIHSSEGNSSKLELASIYAYLLSLRRKGLVTTNIPSVHRCSNGHSLVAYAKTFDSIEEYQGRVVVRPIP